MLIGRRAFRRALRVTAVLALASGVAACSVSVPGINGGDHHASTGLMTALSRVADTDSTREQVFYDDSAALTRLTGAGSAGASTFGPLVGTGATFLKDLMRQLSRETGINPAKEDYAVSAGMPPVTMTLFRGGQDASLVASRMTTLGWKRD